MKIGITLQSLDLTWGGIGTYTREIVRHLLLQDRENEYVLFYPGFGAPRKLYGQYRRFGNAVEVETQTSRVPSGLYWDQVIVPRVAAAHGVDVLFNPFLSVPVRGRFGKVMVMHAVEYHTVPKVYDWRRFIRWTFLERVVLPAADRVISISRTMTDDIQRCVHYPIENVRTIYHGVSRKFRRIEDQALLDAAREEYVLPESFMLFVGHLYPQKNFSTLLRAFHLVHHEVKEDLVVVGRPRWKYEADLRLMDELGLRDRVHFLYYVPHDDLPALYSLATCLVFPSLYEAFGLVALEAMACGCPVIASRAGAIPEIFGGAAILFEPRDHVALADAVRQVSADDALRESLISRGLALAGQFTWERCAAQTLDALREAARR